MEKSPAGAASGRLLRAGGLIVADNVLRRGLVADDSESNPWSPLAQGNEDGKAREKSEYEASNDLLRLREYNDAVAGSARFDAFLAPLYDGVNLARLLD